MTTSSGDRHEGPLADELIGLAVELATRAGALIMSGRAAGFDIGTKSTATDIVTDVDRRVESFIRAELRRRRPADAVLGEESGEQAGVEDSRPAGRPSSGRVRWIVDPIDGTVNFMLGLPMFAVSIAAAVDGDVVAGCVLNPVSGELFRATRGGGAWLGQRRLTGPRSIPIDEAVVATGFGYDPDYRAEQGRLAGELLARVGNLRRLGSAALDLCYVAAGRVDLYYEGPLGEWDFAAGALIALESGAALSGLAGRPFGPAMVAAGHPDHSEEFFTLLTEIGVVAAAEEFIARRAAG